MEKQESEVGQRPRDDVIYLRILTSGIVSCSYGFRVVHGPTQQGVISV